MLCSSSLPIDCPESAGNLEQEPHHSSTDQNAIDIAFKDLTYSVEVNSNPQQDSFFPFCQQRVSKTILKGVSGLCKGGSVTAIIGASGAGKTTLLNTLACRVPRCNLEGDVFANELRYNYEDFGEFANYVMQQDLLLPTLTVRQTLKFAADLKLNKTSEEKELIIGQLLRKFKLEDCTDVLVGDQEIKGISGGEKKRTSIAFELISDPQVLVLDEPTSGLDSLTAFVIVKHLKELSTQKGKTVIMTIHQPNSEIFALFDHLILMAEGFIIYQGPADMALNYFADNFAMVCDQFTNPGQFLISVIYKQNLINSQRYNFYAQAYSNNQAEEINRQIDHREKSVIHNIKTVVPFSTVMSTLLRRDVLNTLRNPMILLARLIQSIIIALFSSGVYARFSGEYTDNTNWRALTGYFHFIAIGFFFVQMTPVSVVFPLERPIFLKEESSKLYGTLPYFLSRSLIELPYLIFLTFLMQVILYWFVNLSSTAEQFFIFFLVALLSGIAGNSIGLLVGSLIDDAKTADTVSTIIFAPMFLFGGYFKNRGNFPVWIGWIEYLSPVKYSFTAFTTNQVSHASTSNIHELNFNVGLWESIAYLALIGVGYRLLSLLLLWSLRTKLQ